MIGAGTTGVQNRSKREPAPLRGTALPVLDSSCCGRVSKSLRVEGCGVSSLGWWDPCRCGFVRQNLSPVPRGTSR